MKECQWTRKVCKELEDQGCEVYPLVASMYGKMHWPDRLIIHRDGMWLVEFKGINTKLRLGQEMLLRKLNTIRAGSAFIARQSLTDPNTLTWIGGRGMLTGPQLLWRTGKELLISLALEVERINHERLA